MVGISTDARVSIKSSKLKRWADKLYAIDKEAGRIRNRSLTGFIRTRRASRTMYRLIEKAQNSGTVLVSPITFKMWISSLRNTANGGLAFSNNPEHKTLFLEISDVADEVEDYFEIELLEPPQNSTACSTFSSICTVKQAIIVIYMVICFYINFFILFPIAVDVLMIAMLVFSELAGAAALLRIVDGLLGFNIQNNSSDSRKF